MTRIFPILLALCAVVYLARLDLVCGLYVDDAWYVVLAQALAAGQGYTLANSPTPGILPFYPPGFPWLLSWVVRAAPAFPASLPLLKSASIVAMMATGLLLVHYLRTHQRQPPPLAAAIALATVLHPGFVFLATSTVMSEPVFTLAQLAAVVMIERTARMSPERRITSAALAAGALTAAALLIRTIAVGLVLAGLARLLLARRWAAAATFAVAVGVLVGPWSWYARSHAPTPAEQVEQNDSIVIGYDTQFWERFAGKGRLGTTSPAELPARVEGAAYEMARTDAGALLLYFPYRLLEPGAVTSLVTWARWFSFASAAVLLVGLGLACRRAITTAELLVVATLPIALLWPFPAFRFLLPLLPFLLVYVSGAVRWATRRPGWTVPTLVVAGLAAVSLQSDLVHALSVRGPLAEQPRWNRVFAERRALFDWIAASTPPDAIIASYDPAQVYLYTGRHSVGMWQDAGVVAGWRRLGVRYFADTAYPRFPNPALRIPAMFETPTLGLRVLDLHGLLEKPSAASP